MCIKNQVLLCVILLLDCGKINAVVVAGYKEFNKQKKAYRESTGA